MSRADDDSTFTAEDAIRVQRELRGALGLADEVFPIQAFIGMISDEIEQFRLAGKSDADVARVIEATIGRTIGPESIARYYAPPQARNHA